MDRFRDGLEKILITTNVLSRGIDIEQVTIVVNFDLPVDVNGAADCKLQCGKDLIVSNHHKKNLR